MCYSSNGGRYYSKEIDLRSCSGVCPSLHEYHNEKNGKCMWRPQLPHGIDSGSGDTYTR